MVVPEIQATFIRMIMNRFYKTTLLTGLLVGATDIIAAYTSAWIKAGAFPSKLLHYIAGGLLGLEASLKGGLGIAALGLLIHFFIACCWTMFFFFVFPRLKVLWFNKYIVGLLYGFFVDFMMRFVVLPMTPLPQQPFNLGNALQGWLILAVVLGLPIAMSAYEYYGVARRELKQPTTIKK